MNQKFTLRGARIVALFLFIFSNNTLFAQETDAFGTWEIWPMHNQLFPRSLATNKATIRVKGTLNGSLTTPRLRFYRGGTRLVSIDLTATATIDQTFEITAEATNYYVRLEDGNDWKKQANNLVAGDVYFIAGQSNAEAKPVIASDNNLANNEAGSNINFVRVFGGGSSSTPAWQVGDGNKNYNQEGNTGQFGMRIGSLIVANEGIPVCIMNGAELGYPIQYFQKNADVDPRTQVWNSQLGQMVANPNYNTNNYGRELTRLTKAGLIGKIRAVIWYQGESNTWNNGSNTYDPYGVKLTKEQYISQFNTLFSSWTSDFGIFEKCYLIQIRPGCFPVSDPHDVMEIQEAQRELDEINPKIDIVSTNDFPKYTGDNCHYFYESGYKKIGDRVYNMMDRDLYNGDPSVSLFTPKPSTQLDEKPKFTAWDINGNPTQLTLYFQHPEANLSVTGNVAPKFTLLGGSYAINNVNIQNIGTGGNTNNVLRINFTRNVGTTTNPTGLRYESDRFGANPPTDYIANSTGISLISFEIQNDGPFNNLPVDPLSLRISSNGGANSLLWEVEGNPDFELFEVERGTSSNDLNGIKEIPANGLSGKGRYQFVDQKPNSNRNYYRIKATKTNGEILYSQVVAVNNNASLKPGISVYPNPVNDRANVSLTLKKASQATIQVFDGSGKLVSTRKLALQKGTNMFSAGEILDYGPGIYLLRVVTDDEVFNARVVRVR